MVGSSLRRSNPQLGGRHEHQGSLGHAGWHRWRLEGNTELSTLAYHSSPAFSTLLSSPPFPFAVDNGTTLPLRELVNEDEDRLLVEGCSVFSGDRAKERVLRSYFNR
ncbi:hypothetical protein PUN28_017252 [Cardiocondyla obscurior]|uniref:Uncharacterized protein n=1 Tax=Cardiocondyla obscurior TaxID=286306 RepID=A0AAW2EQ90_9HYME